ncbi:hypothetical protein Csa_007054 [Cucumis sativus]|uniref:Uncharacterized protein n=1 Tax=Cucumis sativus TaxID=3659 RepID=A0A0A0M0D4_CUCSA|nr:hypothetical protein Csa_007054 [Cucumis sativus]
MGKFIKDFTKNLIHSSVFAIFSAAITKFIIPTDTKIEKKFGPKKVWDSFGLKLFIPFTATTRPTPQFPPSSRRPASGKPRCHQQQQELSAALLTIVPSSVTLRRLVARHSNFRPRSFRPSVGFLRVIFSYIWRWNFSLPIIFLAP